MAYGSAIITKTKNEKALNATRTEGFFNCICVLRSLYRDGRIQLAEVPTDIPEESRVIVTFLDAKAIDLQKRGINREQAAELRNRLSTFAGDWDSEEMSIYDGYDRNKA